MRLLEVGDDDTVSLTLDLPDSELPKHKYAILSHTWAQYPQDQEEVTYDDILKGIGTSKPGVGSQKIRFCIEQTKRDNIRYFWVDTCCIDKSNATVLEEALRSMFRWYQNAEKCYCFLADVPREDGTQEPDQDIPHDIRQSRWFTRGWTLQELLAPLNVEFYSKQGAALGTKQSLEHLINEITKIPLRALRTSDLAEFSLDERRRWQEGRSTRVPEDMVYSLLGLLGLSMPVLYGEGRSRAELRLQQEFDITNKGAHNQSFSMTPGLIGTSAETQHFVGRESEITYMHDKLRTDGRRSIVVLRGLGGMGKTQLSMAYARRYKHCYTAQLWLNANDEDSVNSSLVRIARQIQRELPNAPHLMGLDLTTRNLEYVTGAVKAWLSLPFNTRWLLICDNYDNPAHADSNDGTQVNLARFFPEADQGSIIITTRSTLVQLGNVLHVRKLSRSEEALEILQTSSDNRVAPIDPCAQQLAQKLDGLPLALATAGAYLSQTSMSPQKYLDNWDQSWAELQPKSPLTYEDRTLYTTWQVSFNRLERVNRDAANFLRLWAYFDNQDLWFELLQHASAEPLQWLRTVVKDELSFHESMRVLCEHGLVEADSSNAFDIESRGYSVHPCVHSWMRTVLNAEHNRDFASIALDCVTTHASLCSSPLIQRRLLSHANRCSVYQMSDVSSDMDYPWAAYHIADVFKNQGKLTMAAEMYQRALQEETEFPGSSHSLKLEIMDAMAGLYRLQGKLSDAENMFLQTLKSREQEFGRDHESTLHTIADLGMIYRRQSRLQEAEDMCMRAFKGLTKLYGGCHKSTVKSLINLSQIYCDQHRLAQSEEMLKNALEFCEQSLGPTHTTTLIAVSSLGVLFLEQSRLADAESMLTQALIGQEKALGPDHLTTLETVSNLGLLYRKQGRLGDAEAMHTRALAVRERLLGAHHIVTLDTVTQFGGLYKSQGRMLEAEQMYKRALAGKETALGLNNVSTLRSASRLAILYHEQSKLEQAGEMYARALEGQRAMLGEEHESVLQAVSNLGVLYFDQKRYDETEHCFLRVLRGRTQTLGPADLETIESVRNLGVLYLEQGRLEQAEARLSEVLTAGASLAASHKLILETFVYLGRLYARKGDVRQLENTLARLEGEYDRLAPVQQARVDKLRRLVITARTEQCTDIEQPPQQRKRAVPRRICHRGSERQAPRTASKGQHGRPKQVKRKRTRS